MGSCLWGCSRPRFGEPLLHSRPGHASGSETATFNIVLSSQRELVGERVLPGQFFHLHVVHDDLIVFGVFSDFSARKRQYRLGRGEGLGRTWLQDL